MLVNVFRWCACDIADDVQTFLLFLDIAHLFDFAAVVRDAIYSE